MFLDDLHTDTSPYSSFPYYSFGLLLLLLIVVDVVPLRKLRNQTLLTLVQRWAFVRGFGRSSFSVPQLGGTWVFYLKWAPNLK